MKSVFLLSLLLLSIAGFSQQPVYKEFEVDSAAIPRGGVDYITRFLAANLRKPIKAASEGVGGRVLVQGVVEPDGRITDVTLLRSLRPDLDQEALRVFRLFNAWKPAKKDGIAVRQQVMYPVVFTRNEPFPYVAGNRITYYAADQKLTTNSTVAKYRQLMPVDSTGIPNGDLVIYERGRKNWQEMTRIPLVQRKISQAGPDTQSVTWTGYKNADGLWFDYVYSVNNNGILVGKTAYLDGRPASTPLHYYDNGVLIETDYVADGRTFLSSWYPNGQIRQVRFQEENPSGKGHTEQLINYWEPNGKQSVIDGNGKVILTEIDRSRIDSTKQVRYIEQGEYVQGKRQGLWTGQYDDNSYTYEEIYDKGVLQSGKSQRDGKAPVTYTEREQQPEFQGGMQGLGQFLANNLRYPSDAQKKGQQGRVFVSFVVCTDGTLCDYEVTKGVSPSVDREALRVVKAMSGKWKPGVQRGERVRVKYNLPINFTLE
ncbi:TonB family protein [Spirosoma oryzae]|uniref:TonB family protein n=1 Tax=Spirosoma oryzae TaxID=1469603 RepID=A0A2T0T5F2_9BACT|nr:TonB family protein [Spirosoma oryzae]PRY40869.1 TonB family protein [Spirosoma oryzae]